jgi:hypothetical protein
LLLQFTGSADEPKPRASPPRLLLFAGTEAVNPQPHLRAAFGLGSSLKRRIKTRYLSDEILAIRRFAYVWINPNEDKET